MCVLRPQIDVHFVETDCKTSFEYHSISVMQPLLIVVWFWSDNSRVASRRDSLVRNTTEKYKFKRLDIRSHSNIQKKRMLDNGDSIVICRFGIQKPSVNKQGQKVFWSPDASAKPSETRVVH